MLALQRKSADYVEYGKSFVLSDQSSRITSRKAGLRDEFHFLLEHSGDGAHAFQTLVDQYNFTTVADIGAGVGWHSQLFRKYGKKVTAIDLGRTQAKVADPKETHPGKGGGATPDVIGNFMCTVVSDTFDAVWANHVLEHMENPGLFVRRLFGMLREGGVLALSVPPFKTDTVGGHVTNWHAGLLLQHLVRVGFDCSHVRILRVGYNLSILLKKRSIREPISWIHDHGDIMRMKRYLPSVLVKTNHFLRYDAFRGNIVALNW